MTRRDTSNLQLATWKCFAFHPRVIFIKLAKQSGNLWFDCVYVVLRDSSEEQFLTIADCSKKSCKRNLVLEKILAFGLQIAFHAILRDLDRTAFLALLCVGKKDSCCGLSVVPSHTFPSPSPQVQTLDQEPVPGVLNIWKRRVTTATPWDNFSTRPVSAGRWRAFFRRVWKGGMNLCKNAASSQVSSVSSTNAQTLKI